MLPGAVDEILNVIEKLRHVFGTIDAAYGMGKVFGAIAEVVACFLGELRPICLGLVGELDPAVGGGLGWAEDGCVVAGAGAYEGAAERRIGIKIWEDDALYFAGLKEIGDRADKGFDRFRAIVAGEGAFDDMAGGQLHLPFEAWQGPYAILACRENGEGVEFGVLAGSPPGVHDGSRIILVAAKNDAGIKVDGGIGAGLGADAP